MARGMCRRAEPTTEPAGPLSLGLVEPLRWIIKEDIMPEVHCWEPGPDAEDGCGTTCMLLVDHAGPHEWTRDDQIGISFPPAEDPSG